MHLSGLHGQSRETLSSRCSAPPGVQLVRRVMEQIPLLEHYRDKILSAIGVPGSIVGLLQDVNRAAAETNMFVFEASPISSPETLTQAS